jgi:hypothetical protein
MKYNHILHFNVQGFCNYSLCFFAYDITVRCTFMNYIAILYKY